MLRTRRAKQNRRHRERSKISSRRNLLERLEGRQLLAAAPFSESFDTFTGAGAVAAPAAGQLDSDDWRVDGLSAGAGTFGGTHDTNDFARGTSGGGETTGGVYAFNTGGNNILGVQPSGADFTPGDITLKIDNTSGSAISNWTVNYDVWEYNDQDRSSSLNLWVSADDVNYSQVGGSYDYTTVEAAAGTPAWGSTAIAGTVNQPVADGGSLYLQWRSGDVGGGGSRDEFGIDNVVVQDAGGTFFNISPVDASKPEGMM